MELAARPTSPSIFGEVGEFDLLAQDGGARTLEDFRGEPWLFMSFFTRCSGPCPQMTAQMRAAQCAAEVAACSGSATRLDLPPNNFMISLRSGGSSPDVTVVSQSPTAALHWLVIFPVAGLKASEVLAPWLSGNPRYITRCGRGTHLLSFFPSAIFFSRAHTGHPQAWAPWSFRRGNLERGQSHHYCRCRLRHWVLPLMIFLAQYCCRPAI